MKLRNLGLSSLFTALALFFCGHMHGEMPPKQVETINPFTSEKSSSPEPMTNPFEMAVQHASPTTEEHNMPMTMDHKEQMDSHEHTINEEHTMHPMMHDEKMPMNEEHAMPDMAHDHGKEMPMPEASSKNEHRPTVQNAASIKTLNIITGHSGTLAPLSDNERYVIEDKRYESYLTSDLVGGKTVYTVTVPAMETAESFTIFTAQGTHGAPSHLKPAYHVQTHAAIVTGVQYSEPQPSATERFATLKENYVHAVTHEFDSFAKQAEEIINDLVKNGGTLSTKKQITQNITTKETLTLKEGESHKVTSFNGGSAQSSDPVVVSAALKFEGTKAKPEWSLTLVAHQPGKATLTYSSGTKSFVQPIIVTKSDSVTMHTPVKTKEHAANQDINHEKDTTSDEHEKKDDTNKFDPFAQQAEEMINNLVKKATNPMETMHDESTTKEEDLK